MGVPARIVNSYSFLPLSKVVRTHDPFLEYIKACIDLAHEYVKLGKADKAGALYNHALSLIRQPIASDEIRILFFLRYTESLALTGNVHQRYDLAWHRI